MYCVVAQRQIGASPRVVWQFLTETDYLARWFADTAVFRPGEPFRFDFGDGDFYSGAVTDWEPEIFLGLRWRFVDMGPEYEVRFALLRRKEGTELSIQDRGALTVEEAECLRVGWSEFLMRLDKSIARNCTARFNWRKALTFTSLAKENAERVISTLADPEWYSSNLPNVKADIIERADDSVSLTLNSEAWRDGTTQVRFAIKRIQATDYLFIQHEGWPSLPSSLAPVERRRFVDLWRHALAGLQLA